MTRLVDLLRRLGWRLVRHPLEPPGELDARIDRTNAARGY